MTRPAADGAPVGREESADEGRVLRHKPEFTRDAEADLRAEVAEVAKALDREEGRTRTAGSLTADDLGRTVTVNDDPFWFGMLSDIWHSVDGAKTSFKIDGRLTIRPADTPVHVHDEEAGRG